MSWSLFVAPHPFVPLATFNVADEQPAALEDCSSAGLVQSDFTLLGNDALQPQEEIPTYFLFPPQEPADSSSEDEEPANFIGHLHRHKTFFVMSATQDGSWNP